MHKTSKLCGILNIQGVIETPFMFQNLMDLFVRITFTTNLEGICVHDHYLDQSKNDFNHIFLHVINITIFQLEIINLLILIFFVFMDILLSPFSLKIVILVEYKIPIILIHFILCFLYKFVLHFVSSFKINVL
jgi:hypothetical protein